MHFQDKDLRREVKFTYSRSGGKGGQHVNKTNSKVNLKFNILNSSLLSEAEKVLLINHFGSSLLEGEIIQFDVEEERSQYLNKKIAIERLKSLLYRGIRVKKKRIPTKKSKSVIEKRLKLKKIVSEKKKNRNWTRD